MKSKKKVKFKINEDGSMTFTPPFIKIRKGIKVKPSVPHKDKKKEDRNKHKE